MCVCEGEGQRERGGGEGVVGSFQLEVGHIILELFIAWPSTKEKSLYGTIFCILTNRRKKVWRFT